MVRASSVGVWSSFVRGGVLGVLPRRRGLLPLLLLLPPLEAGPGIL